MCKKQKLLKQNAWFIKRSATVKSKKRPFSSTEFKNFLVVDWPIIHRIINRNKPFWYNMIWGIILLTCLILSVYQIQNRIQLYIASPIIQTAQMVHNDSVYLPYITICGSREGTNYAMLQAFKTAARERNDAHFRSLFENEWEALFNITSSAEIWKLSNIGEDFDEDCNMDPEKDAFSVCPPMKREELWTVDGICATYSFTAPLNFTVKSVATFHKKDRVNLDEIIQNQLKLFIHEDLFEPIRSPQTSRRIVYKDDMITHLHFTMEEFFYLNTPSQPCLDDEAQSECYKTCFMKQYNEVPQKCSLPFLVNESLPLCSPVELFVPKMNYHASVDKFVERCYCPRKCHEINYEVKLESHEMKNAEVYFSPVFLVSVKVSTNVISVSIERFAYDAISLFCDVGGNISLFLGTCLLSMFEVLESCLKGVGGLTSKEKRALRTRNNRLVECC